MASWMIEIEKEFYTVAEGVGGKQSVSKDGVYVLENQICWVWVHAHAAVKSAIIDFRYISVCRSKSDQQRRDQNGKN